MHSCAAVSVGGVDRTSSTPTAMDDLPCHNRDRAAFLTVAHKAERSIVKAASAWGPGGGRTPPPLVCLATPYPRGGSSRGGGGEEGVISSSDMIPGLCTLRLKEYLSESFIPIRDE